MSVVSFQLKNIAKQLCRDLRKNATNSEQIMWDVVRNRKLINRKFYRQYPIFYEVNGLQKFFIADFYNHETKLVIEIDGGYHKRQIEYDIMRTEIINFLGIEVIRFKNEEVENNLKSVIKTLSSKLQ
jgi:very-short-patch-repair endonuclease